MSKQEMHPMLAKIAADCVRWPKWAEKVQLLTDDNGCNYLSFVEDGSPIHPHYPFFFENDVLQARRELGLVTTEAEEEAFEAMDKSNSVNSRFGKWVESVPEGVETHKQFRYLDAKGEDWIDEFAATATVDEFRGAMKFTIGKYLRRAGKKDEIKQEIEKVRDYACRWLEYEKELKG